MLSFADNRPGRVSQHKGRNENEVIASLICCIRPFFQSYQNSPFFSSFIYLNLIYQHIMINFSLILHSLYLFFANVQFTGQETASSPQAIGSIQFPSNREVNSPSIEIKSPVYRSDGQVFLFKGFYRGKAINTYAQYSQFYNEQSLSELRICVRMLIYRLKKHQNKKFDKLVSLVSYAINSADKALKFLNISCNFQAQFACKLFYSDRQTLMKEFNNFSLQECLSNKVMNSSSNSSQIKIIPFDQSILLAESKQLKHENQQLKKELMVIEGQLGKERKSDIWQSKSNHSFFSQHQPNQFKNLLMNKSCEQELLKSQFDFVERQHRRMEHLLMKICKNNEINEFLELIKKQSKYKLESLNSEHSFGERNSFDNLSIISEKKIEALEEKIISEIEKTRLNASQHEITLKENGKLKQVIQVIAKNLELNLQLQGDMVNLAQKECKLFIKKRQKQMMLVQAEFENQLVKSIQKLQKVSSEKETQFQTMMDEKDISLDTLLAEKQSLLQELQDTQRTNNELMDQARQMYQQLKQYKLVKTKEHQQLVRQNNSLKEQIKRIKEQSAFDIKNSEQLLQINQQLQRACSEKQQKLQKEKQQNLRLGSEIQLKKRYIIKKDKELQRKSTVIQQLQYKYELIASSNKQVGEKVQILQAENGWLQSQLQQKTNMLKVANEQSLILTKRIQVFEKQNGILKQQLQLEKARLYEGKDNQLKAIQQEKQRLQNLFIEQSSRIQEQQSQIILLKSNQTLKNQLQEQATNLRKEIAEHSTKQSFLHAQNQELQRLLKDNRQKSKESITALQKLMEHLKEESQQVKNKNNELKANMDLLREQAKVKEENHINAISKMETATLEREDLLLNQLAQIKGKHQKVLSDIQLQRQSQVNFNKKESETLILSIQQLMKELQQVKIQLIQSKRCLSLRQQELQKLNTLINCQKSKYELEIKRQQEELSLCKQRLKNMEINFSFKIQQVNKIKDGIQSENEKIKEQIAVKETEINQKAKEFQTLLAEKQHLIQQTQQFESLLLSRIKSQTELIKELTAAKIALQTELKDRQAADGIMQDLANPSIFSQHVSIISKEDENNFQDFSEYIGQRMEESFISIINSQAMQSFSQCKAEDILQREATSKIKKSNQSEDQFEDFSSSHPRTEDIMFSIDSCHDPQQLMQRSIAFKHQGSSKDNILKIGDQQIPKILHENSLGLGYLQNNQEDGAPLQLSLENNQRIRTQKSEDQNWLSTSLTVGLFSNAEQAGQNIKDRKKIKRTPKKYSLFKEENDK